MNSTNTIKSYEAACDNLSMVLPVSVGCAGEIRTGGWMQEMKTDFPNSDIGSHKHFLILRRRTTTMSVTTCAVRTALPQLPIRMKKMRTLRQRTSRLSLWSLETPQWSEIKALDMADLS